MSELAPFECRESAQDECGVYDTQGKLIYLSGAVRGRWLVWMHVHALGCCTFDTFGMAGEGAMTKTLERVPVSNVLRYGGDALHLCSRPLSGFQLYFRPYRSRFHRVAGVRTEPYKGCSGTRLVTCVRLVALTSS